MKSKFFSASTHSHKQNQIGRGQASLIKKKISRQNVNLKTQWNVGSKFRVRRVKGSENKQERDVCISSQENYFFIDCKLSWLLFFNAIIRNNIQLPERHLFFIHVNTRVINIRFVKRLLFCYCSSGEKCDLQLAWSDILLFVVWMGAHLPLGREAAVNSNKQINLCSRSSSSNKIVAESIQFLL